MTAEDRLRAVEALKKDMERALAGVMVMGVGLCAAVPLRAAISEATREIERMRFAVEAVR